MMPQRIAKPKRIAKSDLDWLAIHEAGHMVAMLSLGYHFTHAQLNPESDLLTAQVMCQPLQFRHCALIYMAGVAAQNLYHPDSDVSALLKTIGADDRKGLLAILPGMGRKEMRSAVMRAKRLLRPQGRAVLAIARVLARKGRIGYAEAAKIRQGS